MKKQPEHYVDNKVFLEAMIAYRKDIARAEKEGLPRPRVPYYIAECFMKIATRLSNKPNFANYSFRDDMIQDGVENCLTYIDNFDPDKGNNPFAYFTQFIYYAFLRRIQKEKKSLYVKYKATQHSNVFNMTSGKQDHDQKSYEDNVIGNEWSEEYMNDFIEEFEEKLRVRREKLGKAIV